MSSPSSYVFYDDTNLDGTRSEGATVTRVAVRTDRIDIYSKTLTRAQKSGVLFEKLTSHRVLSLHRNTHGQKYLMYRLNNTTSNKLIDKSLDPDFNMPHMQHGFYELLKTTLLDWFEDTINREDYWWRTLSDLISLLVSPVYRDPKIRTRFYEVLAGLEAEGHPVTELLREHTTWEEFIYALCPAVQTEEDFSILDADLHNLLPVAVLPTGRTLTSLIEENGSAELLFFRRAFSTGDRAILRFMLANSSQEERIELWEKMRGLGRCFEKAKQREADTKGLFGKFLRATSQGASQYPDIDTDFDDVIRQSMRSHVLQKAQSNSLDFTQIPAESWPDLARTLRTHFISSYENEVRRLGVRRITSMAYIRTGLLEALRRWYAQRIFEPAMKTPLTISAVEARFFELFHAAPWKNSALSPVPAESQWTMTSAGVKFYSVPSPLYALHSPNYRERRDLLMSLNSAVPYNFRLPEHTSKFNAYVEDGAVIPVPRAVASAEEVLTLIESGTKTVDKELVRLGRAVTPENRTAYLLADPKERKFKNTWKYYDWGVTERQRILRLKKNGVKSKADVQMYNALPDEMFYEFLPLPSESGDGF